MLYNLIQINFSNLDLVKHNHPIAIDSEVEEGSKNLIDAF